MAVRPTPGSKQVRPVASKTLSVLIVDENPENRRLLRLLLLAFGYDVRTAPAEAAVCVADDGPPDVALLGLTDPGVAGVAERLGRLGGAKRPFVVALGASGAPGIDLCLPKPVDVRNLLGLFRRLRRIL
jgi:CheY-like chemotaxis protein